MQAHDSSLEKSPQSHFAKAVVVGIAYHIAGKQKEEVDGQITMVDYLLGRTFGISLKEMKSDYHHGGHATKPVENFISRFRSKVRHYKKE